MQNFGQIMPRECEVARQDGVDVSRPG